MLETAFAAGTLVAGACFALAGGRAASALSARQPKVQPSGRDASGTQTVPRAARANARRWLARRLDQAGWHESPERIAALACAMSGGLAAAGLSTAVVIDPATAASLAVAGAVLGTGLVALALRSAIADRRRRLTRELAPLLELFLLELGGGGSAMSALGSVTLQLEGELAAELRRLLIASQLSGSTTLEARLRDLAERFEIPALASLATVLTASREYGTAVTQGVRALAQDLRRAQRRELIAHSRRALNHVLFPAAVGVLLPFLAILMFPAVTSLEHNLR